MLRQLRLARSRGSLVAPNNPVQDRALEILFMLDEWEKGSAKADSIKALLATPGVSFERVQALFPEVLGKPDPFEKARTEDGEYDIDLVDDSELEWATPGSPDEDEEISRWIAEQERQGGSVSAADFD